MRFVALLSAVLYVSASQVSADDEYARLSGHGGPIKGVAVSDDGRFAMTASFDNSVGLWSLDGSAQAPVWLEGHEAAANSVLFLRDGSLAASAGDDFDAILWNTANGRDPFTASKVIRAKF